MSKTSGRFSRFPAVNRDGGQAKPEPAVPVEEPVEEPVVDVVEDAPAPKPRKKKVADTPSE